jgi:hypothetical protein
MGKPSKRNFIAEQLVELKEIAFWEKHEKLNQDENLNRYFLGKK